MSATEIDTHRDGPSEPLTRRGDTRQASLVRWASPLSVFIAAVTFGLATGLLELLLLVMRVELLEDGFFLRSTHFVWMVPLSDLAITSSIGCLLALVYRSTGRLTMRGVVGILTFLAGMSLLLLVRGLSSVACALLAGGIAVQAAPWIEGRLQRSWQMVHRWAGVLAIVLILLVGQAVSRAVYARYLAKHRPAIVSPQAPNIILIVLDTVRFDHLGLYGYGRDTTPNLRRIADLGVRFDRARATAPWTLPSHASLFTGRWPHELDVERLDRLDTKYTTLAEFLRERGYVTAGFVANPLLYGSKSGLARGFGTYFDYPVNAAEVLRASSLGWLLARLGSRMAGELRWCVTSDVAATVTLDYTRKHASALNREFLDWLSKNGTTPFFAFLNYFDAHDPYITPPGATSRCAPVPTSRSEFAMLRDWQRLDKDALSPREIQRARDAYDNCIASLDHDVGQLIDELRTRGVLEKTLLILTADHGEQFGEHGTFGHGLSLYEPEIHVPMLMISPGRIPAGRVAGEAVSLRDVPATILDVVGLKSAAALPGTSFAPAWSERPGQGRGQNSVAGPPALSELDARIPDVPIPRNAPPFLGPIRAIAYDGNVYIRHKTGAEELYDLDSDPAESHDLTKVEAAGPTLERGRRILDRLIPFARHQP